MNSFFTLLRRIKRGAVTFAASALFLATTTGIVVEYTELFDENVKPSKLLSSKDSYAEPLRVNTQLSTSERHLSYKSHSSKPIRDNSTFTLKVFDVEQEDDFLVVNESDDEPDVMVLPEEDTSDDSIIEIEPLKTDEGDIEETQVASTLDDVDTNDSSNTAVESKPHKDEVETNKDDVVEEDKEEVVEKTDDSNSEYDTYTMVSTAYGPDCIGCTGKSAYGLDLNSGMKIVAVDPTVIPLGSKVWVEGYGDAIAGDTGGFIKGNRIDVLLGSEAEARKNWGRRTVEVRVYR